MDVNDYSDSQDIILNPTKESPKKKPSEKITIVKCCDCGDNITCIGEAPNKPIMCQQCEYDERCYEDEQREDYNEDYYYTNEDPW